MICFPPGRRSSARSDLLLSTKAGPRCGPAFLYSAAPDGPSERCNLRTNNPQGNKMSHEGRASLSQSLVSVFPGSHIGRSLGRRPLGRDSRILAGYCRCCDDNDRLHRHRGGIHYRSPDILFYLQVVGPEIHSPELITDRPSDFQRGGREHSLLAAGGAL